MAVDVRPLAGLLSSGPRSTSTFLLNIVIEPQGCSRLPPPAQCPFSQSHPPPSLDSSLSFIFVDKTLSLFRLFDPLHHLRRITFQTDTIEDTPTRRTSFTHTPFPSFRVLQEHFPPFPASRPDTAYSGPVLLHFLEATSGLCSASRRNCV